jgi:hypothetical protein
MNFELLEQILESGTREELDRFIEENQLEIVDGKIKHKNPSYVKQQYEFWDKRQLVKKINLNSLYGAILNPGCRFFDKRIGQSTTLTGRSIAKHMDAFTNELITGKYDHVGESVIYGDSVTGDSMIYLSDGRSVPIEELYNMFAYTISTDGGKEYAIPQQEVGTDGQPIKALGYNAFEDTSVYGEMAYVMRHKAKKKLYKVTSQDGSTVTVTEDHSVIVDRDGFTLEVKPAELVAGDLLITVSGIN